MNKQILTKMAIECAVQALSHSTKLDDFIIRGSFVSQEWMGQYKRPIKDLDLLYLKPYDPVRIASLISDGISYSNGVAAFDIEAMIQKEIWVDSLSPGVRLLIPYSIENQMSELQIDIAVGDPLVIEPVSKEISLEYADMKNIKVKTVVVEIAAAWKLHGLFEHINGPWQSKTLWDLYILCKNNDLDPVLFRQAIEVAFLSRLDPLDIVKRLLYGDFARSRKSIKGWLKDFDSFGKTEFIPMESTVSWIANYLMSILKIENDGQLLSLSEVISYRVSLLKKSNSPQAKLKLKELNQRKKILSTKAYMSILHMPGSRLGESEKTIDQHRFKLLTESQQHSTDTIIVQEKLDGSCVCAYRKGNEIFALGRAVDLANESPNESRRLWAEWVEINKSRFLQLLENGERACGEWLAMAHGTRYELLHEPFVLFDIFDRKNQAMSLQRMKERAFGQEFILPKILHCGAPIKLDEALIKLNNNGHHGALDRAEGLIWRLERNDKVLFRAKYVDKNKVDGCYLTEVTGNPIVWNWRPEAENE